MTIRELYEAAIRVGIENDWRGAGCTDGILRTAKAEDEAPSFDADRLFNPYGDTRIAFGDPDRQVHSILMGIDIRPTEVLLAAQMRAMGTQVDLCLSHHVSCINRGIYFFDDILLFHKYSLAEAGVPEDLRTDLVDRWTSALKYVWKMDTINTARNLDVPLMSIHTPCDLLHVKHTRATFERMKDEPLEAIAAELNRTQEIRQHRFDSVIVHGDPKARPGKVYNPVGAGWRPPIDLFEAACSAGIDTAVLVAVEDAYLETAGEHHVNVVEIPHDSNDNFGINMMLDALSDIKPLTIYEAGNFTRVTKEQRQL